MERGPLLLNSICLSHCQGFKTWFFVGVVLFLSAIFGGFMSKGTAVASAAEEVGTPVWQGDPSDYPRWHLPRGATVRLGKGGIGHSDRAIAFSPDGELVAVASGIGAWLYSVEDPSISLCFRPTLSIRWLFRRTA